MENKLVGATNSELLHIVRRGGVPAIEAAKELLARNDKSITGKDFLTIMESIKIRDIMAKKEEAMTVIETAASRIINGGFLDKNSFNLILHKISAMSLKYQAGRSYRKKNPTIPNYLLKEYLEHLPAMRLWAIEKLKQNPNKDDLFFASGYAKGKQLQEILQKHFEMGMSLEDACGYLESNPEAAEIVWNKLRQEGLTEKLSDEQMEDMVRFGGSPSIRKELGQKLLLRLAEKLRLTEEKQKTNPNDFQIENEVFDLKNLMAEISKIMKELDEKEESIKSSITPHS